jgi:signal transduction histidine kinase
VLGNGHSIPRPAPVREEFADGDAEGIELTAKGGEGLPFTYQGALVEHLAHPGKATRLQAFALGQAAMDGGLKMSDVIRLHHQALADAALVPSTPAAQPGAAPAFESFLLEALMPFKLLEDTRVRQVTFLAEQNQALAQRIARLEAEVADHESAEAALRESKDRYFQLYQHARAKEANLRELSAQVLSAQEEERKHISRELHDEIGQTLTAVNVAVAMLKSQVVSDPAFQRNVADAEQLLAHTMESVHCFARELRPAMLDHLGLQSALRAHILVFTRQTGIRTDLVPHPSLGRLDERREEVLFRVAQEALNNVFKHARATSAKIEFSSKDDALHMEISDNGCAFDAGKLLGSKPAGRIGLLGMQERIRNVNGSLNIESVSGEGTRIQVKIPLNGMSGVPWRRSNDSETLVRRPLIPSFGGSL